MIKKIINYTIDNNSIPMELKTTIIRPIYEKRTTKTTTTDK